MNTVSMETTWAFESSMDQLDSMSARGYGIGKRTHFHLFRWERNDWIHIVEIVILTILNLWAYTPLLFQIFLLSDDHYASISDERSVVDAYDGISVFITMHMEGEF